ncbi:hypothetical protein [Arthrobacter sp. E3]|uniref:hypothetical protein n=1 Tax=Arthrobacter sp. E3 TaxID=517402 RepID=UPI001A949B7A|nr:hypothetical protein [Arthrobacter sp. E3]
MSKETEPIRSRREPRAQSAKSSGATGQPLKPGTATPKSAAGPQNAAARKTGAGPQNAATPKTASATAKTGAAARNTAAAPKTGAATAKTGAGERETGAAAPKLGAVAPKPGSATAKTGAAARKTAVATKTGAATAKTGAAARRSGAATPKTGSAAPKTGAAAAKTGAAARRSGAAAPKTGAAARKTGVAAVQASAGESTTGPAVPASAVSPATAGQVEPTTQSDRGAVPVERQSQTGGRERAAQSSYKKLLDAEPAALPGQGTGQQAEASTAVPGGQGSSPLLGPFAHRRTGRRASSGAVDAPSSVARGSGRAGAHGSNQAPGTTIPTSEELTVVAAQREDSGRAAVLNQRAEARERLGQENARNRRPTPDPTATDNLAMVTPLEFIQVPGIDRSVMRPPATTHVPIVTQSMRQQTAGPRKPLPRSAGKSAPISTSNVGTAAYTAAAATEPLGAHPAQVPEPQVQRTTAKHKSEVTSTVVPTTSTERSEAVPASESVHSPSHGKRVLTGGHPTAGSAVGPVAVAPAEAAAATPAPVRAEMHRSQMPPMPADYAHGLEPLDAMTAGLRRTQRNRRLQWGSLIVGGAALVVGVIFLITSLTR